jgi:hypothetical protein
LMGEVGGEVTSERDSGRSSVGYDELCRLARIYHKK